MTLAICLHPIQVIIEEGQSVPGDARLICDYDTPHEFEKYKELREQHKLNPSTLR